MRSITLTMEVTDEEYSNFLTRLGTRTTVSDGAAPATTAEADDGPVNTAAPSVDSAGVPWLESVHASTKTTVSDGTWRGKKGVTAEQRAAAEAPYRTAAPVPPMPTFTPPAAPAPFAGLPGMPPIAPHVPDVPVTMNDILSKYQELAGAGKIKPEQAADLYAAAGVTDANELTTNETLRRKLLDEMKKYG